jgi:hypothetical protein
VADFERSDLRAPVPEKIRINTDDQPSDSLLNGGNEGRLQFTLGASRQHF